MTPAKGARIRRRVGDVVEINLGEDGWAYAHVLEEPLLAFYDIRADQTPDIDDIVRAPVLFEVWVMNKAVTSGRWKVIGHSDWLDHVDPSPRFFKQDLISKRFSIYEDDMDIEATKVECEGLERAAVWDPTHVEDRLRDHYLGRENKSVRSLSID